MTDIAPTDEAVLRVTDLRTYFPVRSRGVFPKTIGQVKAVDGVSLSVAPGETLGLVGESGCGKSTTGRTVLRLIAPTSGTIELDGTDITNMSAKQLVPLRRKAQMIFQDPYNALNPRHTVGTIIGAPFEVQSVSPPGGVRSAVQELMERVGLNPEHYNRYASEFSGGQRQRIGIARALALSPRLIICDEPVSALDVSVRAQVINLLEDLKGEFGVSYLFISHDLSVVEHIADRVAVMYLGTLAEVGGRDQIWRSPQHPYTKALLAAAPVANPRLARTRPRTVLQGELPSPLDPPAGCPFHSRCPIAQDRCKAERPTLRPVGGGALAACHFV